ncbi:MAG: MerR family transcriptional regulator [Bacteroidales bacterium]|nr:MerR family transcriptional regulator [Bacteroidales bacterium]
MDDLTKSFYKITDVAEMLDVSQSTLRYWEREFPDCAPTRSATNIRYYTPENIEKLRMIHYLLKTKGMKIEAAKRQLQGNKENVSRRLEIIDKLTNVRNELEEMLSALTKRR